MKEVFDRPEPNVQESADGWLGDVHVICKGCGGKGMQTKQRRVTCYGENLLQCPRCGHTTCANPACLNEASLV